MEIRELTFNELASLYCTRQESTPEELKAILERKKEQYKPDGFMLLEAQLIDSSYCGQYVILPYGPHNTYKTVPDHPISPRGLASDMSAVVGILKVQNLD